MKTDGYANCNHCRRGCRGDLPKAREVTLDYIEEDGSLAQGSLNWR